MTSVRRIVTGHNAAGKSCVISDDAAPQSVAVELWQTGAGRPLGDDPGAASPPLNPKPGATQWRIVDIPPYAELLNYLSLGIPGHDARGFHCTDSIDYVIVLDGELALVLDEGEVALRPGDCVVQRRTNHLWRNDGARPARILAVMIGVDPGSL